MFHAPSHPSRVRGLKCNYIKNEVQGQESHPSRVRGLKSEYTIRRLINSSRTLHGCVD